MPSRPLTPAQRAQHRAFLKHLARTGNARAAAQAIGMSDATLHHRRQRHPAFAQRWDATLAAVDARLGRAGGARPAPGTGEGGRAAAAETTVTLRKDGRLQLRRARADAFTGAGEQRFGHRQHQPVRRRRRRLGRRRQQAPPPQSRLRARGARRAGARL